MSRSWRLQNIDTGDATMQAGSMDVEFADGGVDELTDPLAVLEQRIEKSSVEPQGSNPFLAGWGSAFALLLGQKMVPAQIAREVGAGLRTMFSALIAEQQRTRLRILLDPRELISALLQSSTFVDVDQLVVSAVVGTEAGTTAAPAAVVR